MINVYSKLKFVHFTYWYQYVYKKIFEEIQFITHKSTKPPPIRDSTVVSIPACRVGDPGSIPGLGVFCIFGSHIGIYTIY